MQTLRSILHTGSHGAALTDEYGSDIGAKLEFMLGSAVRLEFDLRGEPDGESGLLQVVPKENVAAAAYYFAVDTASVNSTSPLLLKITGITVSVDSEGHTVFSVEIPNTAVDGLVEELRGKDTQILKAEIGGVDSDGTTVFAWQFEVTLRSRVYIGSGSESGVNDPDYYTAVQVEAAICRPLFYEYSVDGENWHDILSETDQYFRVRHGVDGIASTAQVLPRGPQGEKGEAGEAATVEIGSVTSLPMGETGYVVNSGTANAAVLEFGLPMPDNVLPLSGGTMSGAIVGNGRIIRGSTGGNIYISGGESISLDGTFLMLSDKSSQTYNGMFILRAGNDSGYSNLIGNPGGVLTWGTALLGLPRGGLLYLAKGVSTPIGYIMCNGAAVSRTTYAKLFSIIGTTYGAGDGTTTFNLPDLSDDNFNIFIQY